MVDTKCTLSESLFRWHKLMAALIFHASMHEKKAIKTVMLFNYYKRNSDSAVFYWDTS